MENEKIVTEKFVTQVTQFLILVSFGYFALSALFAPEVTAENPPTPQKTSQVIVSAQWD